MSSHKESKVTDRLFWAKGDKELYDSLEAQETFFKNKSRKEQFMFALAFGYYNQARAGLVNYDGMFNSRDLTPIDISILESIALKVEGDISVLDEETKIYRINEEYAHGGIILLHKQMSKTQIGSYTKKLEVFLTSIYEKNYNP